ncbi:MAG: hypothetical protein RLN69_08395, partial [Woeseiaceae bacterium]
QGFRFIADVRLKQTEARISGASADAASRADPAVQSSPRPSIAVLPFRHVGESGPFDPIADGLPDELITELARLRWLFVIARGSSFRLRGQELDMRDVGRLLGVRYCLSGTVELRGKQLIVTTELADTRGGDVVWGERYSGHIDDVHAVRSEIRAKILVSLEIQIPLHEASGARHTVSENLDAWSAYHLGLQHIYRFNQKDNAVAAGLFSRAVRLDPGFARAHAGLSFVHFQTAFLRQSDDLATEITLARDHAQHGVDIDPLDPFVNFTMGRSYWLDGNLDRALSWIERSTSLSPNFAQGIYARAWTETMAGNGNNGREHVDLAMRLSPLDPLYYGMLGTRGLTHMLCGEYADAAQWSDRAARSPGAHVLIAMIAAAAHLMAGNEQEAGKWARDVRERNPKLSRVEFFGAFPIRSKFMRAKASAALEKLGF